MVSFPEISVSNIVHSFHLPHDGSMFFPPISFPHSMERGSQNGSVGIATATVQTTCCVFLSSAEPILVLGPSQPPIQWVPRALFKIKRPGREANHTHPTSAEAKNSRATQSHPQCVLIILCLIKDTGNVSFYLHVENSGYYEKALHYDTFSVSQGKRQRKRLVELK